MFRHLLPLLILVLIFFGIFYGVGNTPWLVNQYGESWLEENIPGLTVQAFEVKRQRWTLPNQLRFSDVHMECYYQGQRWSFDGSEVMVKGTFKTFEQKEPLRFKIIGGNLKTENFELKNASLNLLVPIEAIRNKQWGGDGMLSAGGLRYYHYEAQDTKVRFNLDNEQLQILEATASLYGGNFQSGQVSYKFQPGALLISWSELTDLNAAQLAALSKVLFAGLTGKANGSWRMVGDSQKIEVLAIILSMPEGGTMSADLVKRIQESLPAGPAKKQLQTIVDEKKDLAFNQATLHIQNLDTSTIALVIEVEAPQIGTQILERVLVPLPKGLREFMLTKP